MVALVREGHSQRWVARKLGVGLRTVQRWVERAGDRGLEEVEWQDRSRAPHHQPNRTRLEMERLIIQRRHYLRDHSDLGEYGAAAVRRSLLEEGYSHVPSERTINRIFRRWGELPPARQPRRPSPPRGWYLPAVACGEAEMDQVDVVEGLKIKAGPLVEVLNVVSVHGGLVNSWIYEGSIKAVDVVEALIDHWQEWGLPAYAQFDNDTLFQGAHQHPNVISRVMRLCLALGVVPVFVPPAERGFQAAIEGYNAKWQAKVWQRFSHQSPAELQDRSRRYVAAHRQRTRQRRDKAPQRRAFPSPGWQLNLQTHPADYSQARMVYIRRTNGRGEVYFLGQTFAVAPQWCGKLVRCEVLLSEERIRFYQLSRRVPNEQPMLKEIDYHLPRKPFRG